MSAEVRQLVDPITSARHLARVLDEQMQGDPDTIRRLRASLADANRILAALLADDESHPLGLPFTEVGQVIQSLARQAEDRGVYTKEEIVNALIDADFNEDEYWDQYLGPAVDKIEDFVRQMYGDRS